MNEIAAVARVREHLDVFWIGDDGRVWTSWWHEGLPWSGQFSIGGFFPAGAPIAAVARRSDHLDLFVVGNDGRVYTSWWHEGEPWSGANDDWMSIGGFFPPGASIAAISRHPDHLDVFVVGNDGRVYTSWLHEGQAWSGANDDWLSLGGIFPANAAVSAVARTPDNLDLFITGNDGRVWTRWWDSRGGWVDTADNWAPLGGFFPSGNKLSAVARSGDHLDLFVVGNDGRVYTSWWHEGQPWSGANDDWLSLGGIFPANAAVSAVARTPDNLDLFVTGNDGRVWTRWWSSGGGWVDTADNWASLGGFFPVGAPIASVARMGDHLDLFIRGNDRLTYSSWWHEGLPWSGANDNWFSISPVPGPAIRLQSLRVEKAQEDGVFSDGDEPYLVMLGFRSRFRTPSSTSVFWAGDLHELGELDSGDSAGIPPSMGFIQFPGVGIVSLAEVMSGRFPEVFGAFILCFESDATPFGAVRDLIEKLRGALQRELVRLVEDSALISDFTASPATMGKRAEEELRRTMGNVTAAIVPSALEAIGLWLRSFADPDDLIGHQVVMFAGVDDSLGRRLPEISGPRISVGRFRPGPLELVFSGDDARYRVTGVVTG